MPEPVRVGVLGLGLVGGSLALRLVRSGVTVVGTDPDPATRESAELAGIEVQQRVGPWLAQCALVVVCTPLDVMAAVLADVAAATDDRTTVMDVGSVKGPVHRLAGEVGLGERFVGVHPMAGTEHTGFGHAAADLFDDATWAVTLDEVTGPDRAAGVVRFLADHLGGRVCVLPPDLHDEAAAVISHVPHVVAHLLLTGAEEFSDPRIAAVLAAGSFRDGTRVAGTNPVRTRNMLLENRVAVTAELDRLRKRLDGLRALVAEGDPEALLASLGEVAEQAAVVRRPGPEVLSSEHVDAAVVQELLAAPGARVVVSPRRRV